MNDLQYFRDEARLWFDNHWREKLGRSDPPPQSTVEAYFSKFEAFLPEEHRRLIGRGYRNGLFKTVRGWHVQVAHGPASDTPQYLLNRNDEANPTHELFVQMAEYVRLFPCVHRLGLTPRFEYDDMDIALVRSGSDKVDAYVEVKVERIDAERWLANFRRDVVGREVTTRPTSKKGLKDWLKKGISLADHRPRCFALVAKDFAEAFHVQYTGPRSFRLDDAGADITRALEAACESSP